ncbi:MAG: OsmC family protein, partial [Thermoanaerobaculia bacterium]|nr:OsmC family protein [Thermoanaerobaculia bacterium]
ARAPQADGDPSGQKKEAAAPAFAPETVPFRVTVSWSGDAAGCGEVRVAGLTSSIPIGGATELGGCGKGANPEELLLASIGACFVNTWAIFLKKLQLDYSDPAVGVDGQLEKDPAGGYRMARTRIQARVPASLLEKEREKVQKTLALAEKYCIISKVARQSMPLEVQIEPV